MNSLALALDSFIHSIFFFSLPVQSAYRSIIRKRSKKNSTVVWNSSKLRSAMSACIATKASAFTPNVHLFTGKPIRSEHASAMCMHAYCVCVGSVYGAQDEGYERQTKKNYQRFFFCPENTLPPSRRTHCRMDECTVSDVRWIWWCKWRMNSMHFVLSAYCWRKRRLAAEQNYAGKKCRIMCAVKFGSIQFGSIDVHKYIFTCFSSSSHIPFLGRRLLSAQPFVNASDRITNVSVIAWRSGIYYVRGAPSS